MNTLSTEPSDGALDRLATVSTWLSAAGLLGMVAVQGWQVLARYGFNNSPSWTEPLTLTLLATTLGFGAAAGVHAKMHFRFPLFVALLPLSGQRFFARLSALVIMGLGGWMAVAGSQLFLDGLSVKMAGVALPQSMPFLPLCLGGALMLLFALPNLLQPPTEG